MPLPLAGSLNPGSDASAPRRSRTHRRCRGQGGPPSLGADQAVLIEVEHAKHGVGIFVRHIQSTGHRSRPESEFRVRKFDAPTRACQSNVEGFASEFIDQRSSSACQDAGYVSGCGSLVEVYLESDRQEQGVEELLTTGPVDGEDVAQGDARLARDDRFESYTLGFIRTLVYDDEARAVPRCNFTRPFPQPRPL